MDGPTINLLCIRLEPRLVIALLLSEMSIASMNSDAGCFARWTRSFLSSFFFFFQTVLIGNLYVRQIRGSSTRAILFFLVF